MSIEKKKKVTIFALICWFPGTQKPILKIQVASKINGGGGGPIIYLDTWISNIDFLYTGNQRINANMVNVSGRGTQSSIEIHFYEIMVSRDNDMCYSELLW